MVITSKTGLIASATKKIIRNTQTHSVNLKVVATSAPYVLKPFAGLYNPYPYGCSLLCNHPTDNEAKELLKRAKDTWAHEGKNLLLSDEVDAIRASLNHLHVKISDYGDSGFRDDLPEELFRRYTETDSRPLTPAPTVVSAHTRASGSRRCVTPDPMLNTDVREKTQLILVLRRSHSQETLSWYGGTQQYDVPSIIVAPIHEDRKSSATPETSRRQCERRSKTPSPIKSSFKNDQTKFEKTYLKVTAADENDNNENNEINDEEEESIIKRRGRRRRKRGRDASRGPPFQSSIDPETLVATIGPESHNPSARPSLVPNDENATTTITAVPVGETTRCNSVEIDSYLDRDILKLLRRELDEEVIDNEFNLKRRKALEEAMRARPVTNPICNELKELRAELEESVVNKKLWLNIPKMFSRSSARFELPLDSRELSLISPLQYATEYVSVSKSRKQLYNHIFNKYKKENDLDNDHQRIMPGTQILLALNDVMCKELSDEQGFKFRNLIGWAGDVNIDFKTFCGLSALCERLLAPDYPLLILPKTQDPCHEIEIVDFQSLERKLGGQTVNKNLVTILYGVRDS